MTYSAEVLADSPLAYWRLGEASASAGSALNDASGHAHNGTYELTPFGVAKAGLLTGDTDTCMQFDGITWGAATISPASWMDVTAFTAEVWFKLTSVTSAPIFTHSDWNVAPGAAGRSWSIAISGSQLNVTVTMTDGTYINQVVGPTLVVGTKYHVVLTWDGITLALYLNNALIYSSTALSGKTLQPAGAGISMRVGAGTLSPGNRAYQSIPGYIDEVAFYDFALSSDRISSHYLTGTTVQGPTYSTSTSLAATGQLSATGVVTNGGSPAYSASVDLAGTGQLIAAGSAAVGSAGDLVGAGAVMASGIPTVVSSGALSGSGILEVASTSELVGAAELDGLGLLMTMVVPSLLTDGALDGSGGLVAIGSPAAFVELALSGVGALLASEDRDITVSASLRGDWQAEVHGEARTAQARGGWTARSRG